MLVIGPVATTVTGCSAVEQDVAQQLLRVLWHRCLSGSGMAGPSRPLTPCT